MTTVLVTGATGLLGRRVTAALRSRTVDVVTTSRSGRDGSVMVDLMSPEATGQLVEASRPGAIVHLAGGRGGSEGVYLTNVVPTVNLLDAVATHAPDARVLLAGSAAEYGEGAGIPLSESAACVPANDYGRAKLAETEVARALANRHDIDLLVVRPFNVVAPDLPATTPLGNIHRQLQTGEGWRRVVRCGRIDVVRDFVSATGVAEAVAELLLHQPTRPILNLCSGTGLSLAQIVDGLADALGVSVQIETDPELASLPAADRVVGDPEALRSLGLELDGSVDAVVGALCGRAMSRSIRTRDRP